MNHDKKKKSHMKHNMYNKVFVKKVDMNFEEIVIPF